MQNRWVVLTIIGLFLGGFAHATIIDDFGSVSTSVFASSSVSLGNCGAIPNTGLSVDTVNCSATAHTGIVVPGSALSAVTRRLVADFDGHVLGSIFAGISTRVDVGAFSSDRDSQVYGQSQADYLFATINLANFPNGLAIDVIFAEPGATLFFYLIDTLGVVATSPGLAIPASGIISSNFGTWTLGSINTGSIGGLGFVINQHNTLSPHSVDVTLDNFQFVPEPASMALMGLGLVGLSLLARRRRSK